MIAAFCLWFGLACGHVERDLPMPTHAKPMNSMAMATPALNQATIKTEPVETASMFPVTCDVQPPGEFRNDFAAASRRYRIDACDLARQTRAESSFDPQALSPAGAEGISQFRPPTSSELGVNPWNPRESIFGQARYLGWCRDRWSPDLYDRTAYDVEALGLVCYNWGLGNMYEDQRRHGWGLYVEAEPHFPHESTTYVRKIAGPPPVRH